MVSTSWRLGTRSHVFSVFINTSAHSPCSLCGFGTFKTEIRCPAAFCENHCVLQLVLIKMTLNNFKHDFFFFVCARFVTYSLHFSLSTSTSQNIFPAPLRGPIPDLIDHSWIYFPFLGINQRVGNNMFQQMLLKYPKTSEKAAVR